MPLTSLGDLSQSFMLRRQNLQMRQDVNRLSEELTKGQAADPSRHLSGDFSYLSDIERSLGLLKGYRTSVREAAVFTSAMQTSLETIQNAATTLAGSVLDTASSGLPSAQSLGARAAVQAFSQIVSSLNVQVAGRSLFAGIATDQPALADVETLLASLQSAVSGQVSADAIRASVDAWFDDPSGGFESHGYLGSTTSLAPYRLDQTGSVNLDLRADSPALKEVLKFVALSALAEDATTALPELGRKDLLRQAGEGLLASQDKLTALRADLGFAEARIEEGSVRLSSERSALELARNSLLAVDPFETAVKLQAAQAQLESLYAVTVRLSRLSLAEFMR